MEKRPAGLAIISFIYVLIAVIGLTSSFSMSTVNWFSTVTLLLLGISGIGFFMGQKWAWWIIGTMTLFSIFINIPQLLMVIINADVIPDIQKHYLKHGGKIIIQGLILAFMFSQPVIKYFVFENITKTKQFFILVAAAAGTFLTLYLF
ncbi:MAG: hypothetical protein ACSHWU_00275 [Marinicella sp.]